MPGLHYDESGGLRNPGLAMHFGGPIDINEGLHRHDTSNLIRNRFTQAPVLQNTSTIDSSEDKSRVDVAVRNSAKLAQCDISKLDFSNKSLQGGVLDDCDSSLCKFESSNLSQVSAAGAIFDNSSMRNLKVQAFKAPKASFKNCDCRGMTITGDLRESSWDGANLDGARISADLRGSNILEACKSKVGLSLEGSKLTDRSYLDRKYK
jgi:uncharacterized protein YjbI with pentapeptide repeats